MPSTSVSKLQTVIGIFAARVICIHQINSPCLIADYFAEADSMTDRELTNIMRLLVDFME